MYAGWKLVMQEKAALSWGIDRNRKSGGGVGDAGSRIGLRFCAVLNTLFCGWMEISGDLLRCVLCLGYSSIV